MSSLYVRHIAPDTTHPQPDIACQPGQTLRADHEQRHDADYGEFLEADIEHGVG